MFDVTETPIAGLHAAMRTGLTAHDLVAAYRARIDAYDRPTGLNALFVVKPAALAMADDLDAEFTRTGRLRPLHGIPVILKDNFDTADLPTTAGSRALAGSIPPDDAFLVRRLRAAGAIVLAKANMAEWAFSPYVTESSLGGITRNPYDLTRVPAGSSGGTAAGVAANLGAVGLGTDTGNSVRGPSSHTALVGLRPTLGLTSRDGIIPLYRRNDTGGPMTRTVADAARLLDVLAGPDPADPLTAHARGHVPETYTRFLDAGGLRGARLGVFRRYVDEPDADPEVVARFEEALRDLRAAGAELVDPFDVPGYAALIDGIWCNRFRYDVDRYLASLGPDAPVHSLAEVVASGRYAPVVAGRLRRALAVEGPPEAQDPPCLDVYHDARNVAFRRAVEGAMTAAGVDAVVYPTWRNPPRPVGDRDSPAGDNSQYLAPQTGFPALTVPMGYTHGRLPAGLTFVGRLFDEPLLFRLGYAYEQATHHRRPPPGFGPLP